MEPQKPRKPQKLREGLKAGTNSYLKYTGIAFQLFATIAVFAWLGYKMDHWWNDGRALFLIIMLLVGTFGAFYQLFKSLPKDTDAKK